MKRVFLTLFILTGCFLFQNAAYAEWRSADSGSSNQQFDFAPLPRGEMYDREFLDDFWNNLGYRPEGLSIVDESEAARLLITAGSQAYRGDVDDAILTYGLLPDDIARYFPFIITTREDLLVPEILASWYDDDQAREMIFRFYTEDWATHPEYRDDFIAFRDDTQGRASRLDPDEPAVWVMGHLAMYGFSADAYHTEDDPYLFLWDFLTSLSYYVQRSSYYGLEYDNYRADDYREGVLRKSGEMIKTAFDEAKRLELSRTFWGGLIESYHPLETPENIESTVPTTSEESTEEPLEVHPVVEESLTTEEESPGESLFIVPEEYADTPSEETEEPIVEETEEPVIEEPEDIESAIEEVIESANEIAETTEEPTEPTETPIEEVSGPDVTDPPVEETTPVEEEVVEPPIEETPVEVIEEPVETVEVEPTEPVVEQPIEGLGNYAVTRLAEIAGTLESKIQTLAAELGSETVDLVILYNDPNISEDAIANAETRYISKREAFLAGLGVWDRFEMESYSPLSYDDLNDDVVEALEASYESLKNNADRWAQYSAYETKFQEALAQISSGVNGRRDDPDVLAAEAAALTAFLGEYNDMIKEIEDLLSGAGASDVVAPE